MKDVALMGGIAQVPRLQKDEWNSFSEAREAESARISNSNMDKHDLNRIPHEPLYLMVKDNTNESSWRLPETQIQGDELLHQAADRFVEEELGASDKTTIETWRVGDKPIAVLQTTNHVKVKE
jgi:hypothetical protein